MTTEANAAVRIRASGTLQNVYIVVQTNTRVNDSTVISRKNGSNGNISITIGAGLTGTFSDTTHTDTLTSGDTFCFAITLGASAGTLGSPMLNSVITSTGATNDLFSVSAGNSRTAGASANFAPITGALSTLASTTESLFQLQHGFPVKITNLRVYVSANTYTGSAAVKLRVNGADGNQNITVGSGLTGIFEDNSNSDTVVATDNVCVSVAGGTANSATFNWLAVTETDATSFAGAFGAVETPLRFRPIMLPY
jgi:hypothetical protein